MKNSAIRLHQRLISISFRKNFFTPQAPSRPLYLKKKKSEHVDFSFRVKQWDFPQIALFSDFRALCHDIRLPINNNHNILSGNSLRFREISFFSCKKCKDCIEKNITSSRQTSLVQSSYITIVQDLFEFGARSPILFYWNDASSFTIH